jgi:transposase
VPDAVTVMDPFHVALAGAKLDLCRQRVQQDTTGHRGRTGDPLYRARRTLRTRTALLTARQKARLETVFAAEEHTSVEVTWLVYQQIITAYAHPDPREGRTLLTRVIDTIRAGLPAGLDELATLGRTLQRRRPTYWPTSPTEPPTARPRPSTADSKRYGATPSASAT